jgi:hypothetical protein
MLRFTALLMGVPATPPLQSLSNQATSSSQQTDDSRIRLTDAEARRCLEAVNKVPLLQQRLGIEGQDLQSKTIEVSLLQSELSDTLAAVESWHQRAATAETLASEAAEDLGKWYHDPVITGLLGFTGGVLATGAAVLMSHH